MTDLNRFKDVTAYESRLQELAWTIAMSQGQFSLILVRCNYPALHERMLQRLRELCSVEIREIVLDKPIKRLYSTIQEQLGDEQPPAVMVFGLEVVSDIDQMLISMNRVREEFRKNFHFPLVLWIDDQILKKLIRLVPDFESWATTIKLTSTIGEPTSFTQQSTDEQVQHQGSEDFTTYNQRSLRTLCRALTLGKEEFSLILVHCNYAALKKRMLQQLREICPINFRELFLEKSVKNLYIAIREQLGDEQPPAVVVFGYEPVIDLDQLLTSLDNNPEIFRASFRFPLVLCVTDEMLQKLMRFAPDFASWAATPIKFEVATSELIDFLRQKADSLFTTVLSAGSGRYAAWRVFTHHSTLNRTVGCDSRSELDAALRDLQNRQQPINPELEASLQFVFAFYNYANDLLDSALDNYQKSLRFWRASNNLERQGVLLFYIGLCYCRLADLHPAQRRRNLEEAWPYLQQCVEVFKEAGHQDLVAQFITQLAEVLQRLEAWEVLQGVGQTALALHQNYGSRVQLAQDYGFLAEVALQQSRWADANKHAQQALSILVEVSSKPIQHQGLHRFLLAQLYQLFLVKSQREQGLLPEAEGHLETASFGLKYAIESSDHRFEPQRYLHLLEGLRSLYFEQGQYLEAFRIKQEERSVEQLYGFRAFIGAARLQPQRSIANPTLAPIEQQEIVAQEIAASGRQQDINRLIERMSRADCKLTVIHGHSGVGKSSIVSAGLVPALKHKALGDRIALPIVLQVYTNWVRELGTCLAASVSAFSGGKGEEPINQGFNASQNLREKIQTILAQLRYNTEHYFLTILIFDQFEEFFFVSTNQSTKVLFYEFLKECLNLSFVKVILSLREDYLHHLLKLEEFNLEVIDNNILSRNVRYSISNFSLEDAYSVIQNLTGRAHFYLEPALIDQLVKDLAGERGTVRPIELQLVGSQLQAENITTLIQYQERGSKEELVKRSLEEIVEDCGFESGNVAWLVLYLLTNKNGTRPFKSRSELELISELESEKLDFVLDVLVKSGLVLLVPEVPEDRYQLVHDYLVTFIRQKQESAGLVDVEVELKLTKGQLRQAQREQQIANIRALNSSSQALLLSHDQLGALIAGLEAGKTLQQITAPSKVKIETVCSLRQAVYSVRERNRFQGHDAGVNSISFSPDGQTLASASEDGIVQLWQSDGNKLQTFPGQGNRVTSLSFSPDEKTLISAGGDGTLKLWRLVDATELQTLRGHNNRVTSVSFSPDGQTVASASEGGTVKLWRIIGSKLQIFHEHEDLVYGLSFSPDSQTIACAGEDGKVKLWHLDSTELQTFQGHGNRVTSIDFSPDGQTLVSASLDGTVKLWHLNGTELQELKSFQAHRDWVTSISFSPDGQTIASASEDGSVKLWSLEGNELQIFRGHHDKVTSIRFSPNCQTLASASGDGTVKLWSLRGNELKIFRGHRDKVTSVRFSSDGQTVASAAEDGTLKLWHSNGTELETRHNHRSRVTSLSFSPDGQTLASSDEDGNVEFWSLDCDELLFPLLHTNGVTSVSFSPDGQALAFAGEDGTIELRSKDGADLKASCKYGERVTSISFSPDSQTLASASGDGVVKLWRFIGTQLQELQTFQAHSKRVASISFSPDGKTLASASEDCTVKLWSLDSTELQVFRGHNQRVTSISFSPDGQTLASASEDCTVKLWNIDGTEVQTFKGHGNWVTDISFSPDGQTLASASLDGTVILWNLNLDDLLERASNWLRDYRN